MAVHAGSIWMDQNWGSLPAGFWVAASASGIVAEDRDYDLMLAAVSRQGIALSDVAIILVPVGVIQ
jgi:hypothetical protein